jgi:hypothetical protein
MRDVAISTNNFYDNGRLRYLVPKYKAPTVHLYSPVTGAIDRIRNAVDSADVSAYNIADIGESGLWITSDDAGLLVNKGYCWHYTLDSDI